MLPGKSWLSVPSLQRTRSGLRPSALISSSFFSVSPAEMLMDFKSPASHGSTFCWTMTVSICFVTFLGAMYWKIPYAPLTANMMHMNFAHDLKFKTIGAGFCECLITMKRWRPSARTPEKRVNRKVIPHTPVMSAICVKIFHLYAAMETVPHG